LGGEWRIASHDQPQTVLFLPNLTISSASSWTNQPFYGILLMSKPTIDSVTQPFFG
jgi:hypothetical protein